MYKQKACEKPCTGMDSDRLMAWKRHKLSDLGRTPWAFHYLGKAVLWKVSGEASGSWASVCAGADPAQLGDLCPDGPERAWPVF